MVIVKFILIILLVVAAPVMAALYFSKSFSNLLSSSKKEASLGEIMVDDKFNSSRPRFYELDGTPELFEQNSMTSNNSRVVSDKLRNVIQ